MNAKRLSQNSPMNTMASWVSSHLKKDYPGAPHSPRAPSLHLTSIHLRRRGEELDNLISVRVRIGLSLQFVLHFMSSREFPSETSTTGDLLTDFLASLEPRIEFEFLFVL